LKEADMILLLVSSAFLDSTYCYKEELTHAIERHEAGTARVIPIILRPCHWAPAPFAKIQGLPKGMRPVTSWPQDKRDEAWTEVAKGIHKAAEACFRNSRRAPVVASSVGETRDVIKNVSANAVPPVQPQSVHNEEEAARSYVRFIHNPLRLGAAVSLASGADLWHCLLALLQHANACAEHASS
jgi:hypothetical protein